LFNKHISILIVSILFLSLVSLITKQLFVVQQGITVEDALNSWSANWVDYNNDGFDDLYVPSNSKTQFGKLYENENGIIISEVEIENLTTIPFPLLSSVWVDVDNDGFKDIFTAPNSSNAFQLLKQNANNQFDKIHFVKPVYFKGGGQSTNAVDYDLDGDIDLLVIGYTANSKILLYDNIDGLSFRLNDKISETLSSSKALSISSVWSDVNGDKFPDLFLPQNNGSSILFINESGNNFTKKILHTNQPSVGAAFGDLDNDLDFDLIVTNASNSKNTLYLNDGYGNFEVYRNSIIDKTKGNSHGIALNDFDNNGWLDVLITNDSDDNMELYLNNGNMEFVRNNSLDISNQKCLGIATSDYDLDGDEDIYIVNHTNQKNIFIENTFTNNNWIGFMLNGTKSNKDAIGAKVKIRTTIDNKPFWQVREIKAQSGGLGSQNSLKVNFGLHNSEMVDSLIIEWPSGIYQKFAKLESKKYYAIDESNSAFINEFEKNDPIEHKDKLERKSDLLSIYPNPVKDYLHLKSNGENVDAQIVDINGKKIWELFISNSEIEKINLSGLASGTYIIIANSESEVNSFKFIKQ